MKVKITETKGLTISGKHYEHGEEIELSGAVLSAYLRFQQVAPVNPDEAEAPPPEGLPVADPAQGKAVKELIGNLTPKALQELIKQLKPLLEEGRAKFLAEVKAELTGEISTQVLKTIGTTVAESDKAATEFENKVKELSDRAVDAAAAAETSRVKTAQLAKETAGYAGEALGAAKAAKISEANALSHAKDAESAVPAGKGKK